MNIKKYFLSLILGLFFVPGIAFALNDSEEESVYIPAEERYSDITINTVYRYAIGWLSSYGPLEGYIDGTFRPQQTVNRAEFLKMVYGTFDSLDLSYDPAFEFPDVDQSAWYAPYVSVARKRGSIQGYPDGLFRPDQTISRVEGMKILLYEILGSDAGSYIGSLSEEEKKAMTGCYNRFLNDLESGSWYEIYVIQLHDRCIIPREMVDEHLLLPEQPLSRGETAELLFRALAVRDNHNLPYNPAMDPDRL